VTGPQSHELRPALPGSSRLIEAPPEAAAGGVSTSGGQLGRAGLRHPSLMPVFMQVIGVLVLPSSPVR
jgi:hypothetical protein